MSTKLKELNTKLTELKEQIQEDSKAAFQEAAKEFFEKNPAVESFSWRQFTVYFNDGDECNFSVHGYYDSISINGVTYYEREEDDKKLLKKYYEEASKLVSEIDEDTMEVIFGDHVEVIVTPKGITIKDYSDHD